MPGTRSAFADRSTGGFYLDVDVDRAAAARYGLRVADVNQVVTSAVGGMEVSQAIEGRERYPISVRYAREFRDDPAALERVLVPTAGGQQVPLRQVARLSFRSGPPMIRSEDGSLVGYVFVDPGERAIADYVEEARERVDRSVRLPAGTRLEWAGQFRYFERAKARLKVVVPVTLLLIALLLYLNTGSAVEVGDRAPRRTVLARRRHLAALAARLQHERGRLGGAHRPRRARRRDRRGDAALPDAVVAAMARRRTPAQLRRPARSRSSRARRNASARS